MGLWGIITDEQNRYVLVGYSNNKLLLLSLDGTIVKSLESRSVVPNVGRTPHRWGTAIFWWGISRTCTNGLTIQKTI